MVNWDRKLASVIDHTVLGSDSTDSRVRAACDEARRYGFASLVVSPYWLPFAVELLDGTPVRSCTVVSFPFGFHAPEDKTDEARRLIEMGADELDVVMNVGAFLSGRHDVVEEEVRGIAWVCGKNTVFKLIIETARLTAPQMRQATKIALDGGADFVKTSSGFAKRGVTVQDVEVIKSATEGRIGIKAAGGIKTAAFARALLGAGATRLGCSRSVAIVRGDS